MAQSNWVFNDNEDEDSNIINFGTTLMFDSDEDQAAAMQDFAFCTTEEGDYFLDNNESSGAFNPKVSNWNDTDDSTRPSIYVDKAQTDLFKQFNSEFTHITEMINALPTEGDETMKITHLFFGKDSKI